MPAMLSLSSEAYFLEEADSHIQANLEDAVVQEALKNGVDLRQYSKEVEDELKIVENESIQDYINESRNIASLHNQIMECDQLLGRMEDMLINFQNDLGSISSEILSLQQQSVRMNMKLKNRQAVRGELTQFVDEMAIPEQMIRVIMETPVQDTMFLDHLQNLEQKLNFLKEQSFRDARSCSDVKEIADKLKLKAVAKIREFFLQKINLFKKPMTNYHIPQNTILKSKFYFKFLLANGREVAKEIKEFYVDTMSKVLFSYFKSYSGRLAKLQFENSAGQEDLMGHDDSQPRGFFSRPASGKITKASVFSMGERSEVLGADLEAPIFVPHALEKAGTKCAYEKLFRSEQYGLMENACREYLFLCEFFMVQDRSATDLFNKVFGKTLQLLLKNVSSYAQDSFDSIALFLCIHLVNKFRFMSRDNQVPALESYWDSINGQLWPRLKEVINLNVQSIKECDPQKMKILDLRPHYVTRRYAEFSSAFIGVNETAMGLSPESKLINLLSEMQMEIENFILKMASVFEQRKDQLIFLINNYDVMLSILGEKSNCESKEADTFRTQLTNRSTEYVEVVLGSHFGGLISFVKEAEHLVERGEEDKLKSQEHKIGRNITTFNSNWKTSLDAINHEILNSFPNFKNGTAILQQALTQFVQYYHRFHKVMSINELSSCPNRNLLINVHQVMVEVKKYKPSF